MEMVPLADLWLPILLSAVFVFLVSSVFHMATPWHRRDYAGLPGEDSILDAIRAAKVPPGDYMFPHCESFADAQKEEMKRKFDDGPVGVVSVLPKGGFRMGPSMAAWFLYALVVSAFAGYLAGHALPAGEAYGKVHQVAGTAGILGFAFWHVPVSIWKCARWSTTLRFMVDGVVYGLVIGGTFGWLWPEAA